MKVLSWFNIILMCHLLSGTFDFDCITLKSVILGDLILRFMQSLKILMMEITTYYSFNMCVKSIILFYSTLVNKNVMSWLAFRVLHLYFFLHVGLWF